MNENGFYSDHGSRSRVGLSAMKKQLPGCNGGGKEIRRQNQKKCLPDAEFQVLSLDTGERDSTVTSPGTDTDITTVRKPAV